MPHHRFRTPGDEPDIRRGADTHEIAQDVRGLEEGAVDRVAERHNFLRRHVRRP